MTRILFVIDAFGGDGPTRSLIALAEALQAAETPMTLDVATLSDAAYPMTLMQARRAGLGVHRAPSDSDTAALIEAADVVVPLFWNSPTMHQFLRRPWPAMRLAPWLQINGEHPPQTLSAGLIEASDTLICTARSTRHLPELAAARTKHLPALPNLSRLSDERPGEDDPFTVTYLGTINGAKMHPHFVAMSAAIDVPDIRILIHGAGGGEQALAAQIAASRDPGRFELGGWVENVGAVLSRTHVLGYPLKPETYATTEKSLIEAMAAGVCPVVFAHGGVSEIVDDGVTGLVVDDERSYSRAIRWLFDHPGERTTMGDAARKAIRARFEPASLAARFGAIVDDVVSRPRRTATPAGTIEGTAADLFIAGLGRGGELFVRSRSADADVAADADRQIRARHDHLGTAEGGIIQHRNVAPDDPWLRYWSGLVLAGADHNDEADRELAVAEALDPAMRTRRRGNP